VGEGKVSAGARHEGLHKRKCRGTYHVEAPNFSCSRGCLVREGGKVGRDVSP
jgi:hypothetical protein